MTLLQKQKKISCLISVKNSIMAQKKGDHFLKKIFIFLLFTINFVIAIALLFAFLSQYISPTTSMTITYCGLFFPYIALANFAFVILWIFIRARYLLMSLICLLINVNNIDRYYQLRGVDKPQTCNNCLKVMSYNSKLFGLYNSSNPNKQLKERNTILSFLSKESPDIVCFQEYFYTKNKKLNFSTTDSIISILNLSKSTTRESHNFYSTHFPVVLENSNQYGLAIFSKYRIVNKGFVDLRDSLTSNGAMFADIKYRNDTIRVYCLHLESFHMDKLDHETGRMIASKDLNNPDFNKKAKKLSGKLSVAYKRRTHQADIVRAHIDSCHYPIIICGDFNDTPVSYITHTIGKGFRDTFRTGGNGQGKTYIGDAFPSYRIDYIFHDKKFNSYGHTVCEELTVSDHYPIYSYISVRRR